MADITPVPAEFGVVRQTEFLTHPSDNQYAVGDIVKMDSNGKWVDCDADSLEANDIVAIIISRLAHGYTGLIHGIVSLGYAPLSSQSIGDKLWASETAKKLADAAPSTSGATVRELGTIIPHWGAEGDKVVLFDGTPAKAPTAAAIDGIAITYTSNDPSITPNGAVTIADGSTPTVAELLELAEELIAKQNAQTAALIAAGLVEA